MKLHIHPPPRSFPAVKAVWCLSRHRDLSVGHQLVLEEDFQGGKNVSVPGGGTGLKSHLESVEQC